MAEIAVGDARFDFGRVVGQTFGLIGRNFFAFVILALLLVGLPGFGILYLQNFILAQRPDLLAWAPLATTIFSMVMSYILQGALTRASVDDLSHKGVNLSAALGDGLRYLLPLFAVGLLATLGVFIGLIFLVIPGLILMVRWVVAGPAIVIEQDGPTHALGRSAELTEDHRWAIFGLLLLYLVFVYSLTFGYRLALSGASGILPDAGGYVFAAVSAAVGALLSLVRTVGMASLYFELRRVKDGVGIDEIAKVFD